MTTEARDVNTSRFKVSFFSLTCSKLLLLYTDNKRTIAPSYSSIYPHDADDNTNKEWGTRQLKETLGSREMTARGSRRGCVSSPWYVFIFLLTFSYCVRPPPSPHTPALVVTMATGTPYFSNSLFIFLLTTRRLPTATNDDPRENSGIFLILFFALLTFIYR